MKLLLITFIFSFFFLIQSVLAQPEELLIDNTVTETGNFGGSIATQYFNTSNQTLKLTKIFIPFSPPSGESVDVNFKLFDSIGNILSDQNQTVVFPAEALNFTVNLTFNNPTQTLKWELTKTGGRFFQLRATKNIISPTCMTITGPNESCHFKLFGVKTTTTQFDTIVSLLNSIISKLDNLVLIVNQTRDTILTDISSAQSTILSALSNTQNVIVGEVQEISGRIEIEQIPTFRGQNLTFFVLYELNGVKTDPSNITVEINGTILQSANFVHEKISSGVYRLQISRSIVQTPSPLVITATFGDGTKTNALQLV